MQAAILMAKLPHLDGWVKNRQALAVRYDKRSEINRVLPFPKSSLRPNMPILVCDSGQEREKIQSKLAEAGVGTRCTTQFRCIFNPALHI